MNSNSNVNNTVANTVANTIATTSLEYDESLLTEKERNILEKGWDGGLCLTYTSLPAGTVAIVHDGEFHADEVLSVALLASFVNLCTESVVRSRLEPHLNGADLRIDVGEGILDHHGKRALKGIAACSRVFQLLENSHCFIRLHRYTIDQLRSLVDEVAACDTGVAEPGWLTRVVQVHNRWCVTCGGNLDTTFYDVVNKVGELLKMQLLIWEAEAVAEAAALEAIGKYPHSRVILFPEDARAARCKELIYANAPDCVYYVSPEIRDGNTTEWRVLCAADPNAAFSFKSSRRLIPEKFRGFRGEGLSRESGIPDGVFSHKDGFIAAFSTAAAAIMFAFKCLEED